MAPTWSTGFCQIYLTLMIDGVGSPPFSATLCRHLIRRRRALFDQVHAESRAQFGKPRVEVEEAIRIWNQADEKPPVKPRTEISHPAPRTEAPRPKSATSEAIPAPATAPATPKPHIQAAARHRRQPTHIEKRQSMSRALWARAHCAKRSHK